MSTKALTKSLAPTPSGITELILTRHAPDQATVILPMLAYLTQHLTDRWVTWISSHKMDKETLLQFGINPSRLRVIYVKNEQDILWVTREALAQGNSHTVVANTMKLTEKETGELELAALQGHCQGLLLRERD